MGSIVTQLYLLRKNKGISVNVDPVSESKHHTIPVPLFQSEKVISIPCSRFREGKKYTLFSSRFLYGPNLGAPPSPRPFASMLIDLLALLMIPVYTVLHVCSNM